MTESFAGKVAVITGGASGIGRATTLRLLEQGAKVVVGDLNTENGDRLVEEVGDAAELVFVRTNVAEEAEVEALVATATENFHGLDVMFNNAGVAGAIGPLTETSVDDWDRTFAVIARSVFLGIKHGGRAMIKHARGGSIINTASVAGLCGGGGPQAYSAAKAAVVNLTYNAAVELAEHRIRVNAICPGIVDTPIGPTSYGDEARQAVGSIQPWPEVGQPQDIAELVVYLAGPQSRFVNGAAIRIDGALLAAGPRLVQAADPFQTARRFAGYTDGTTGRPNTMRRLAPPSDS